MPKKLLAFRDEIVALYRTGQWTYQTLGERYGVTLGTIYNMMKIWMEPSERKAIQKTLMAARMYPESCGRIKQHETEIVAVYRKGGTSSAQLAKKYNCSRRVIQTILARANISKEERRKIAAMNCRKGVRHAGYRGGKRTNRDGYIEVKVNGVYRREHRVVAATALGRELAAAEVVHHEDDNPSNNAPRNLWLFPSNGVHSEFHHWVYRQFAASHPKELRKLHKQFAAKHGCTSIG